MASSVSYELLKSIPADVEFADASRKVSVIIAGISVNAYPNWYVAMDANGRIHMFSDHPKFHESIGRWLPTKAPTVVMLLDTTQPDSEYCKVSARKAGDEAVEYERHKMTDREIRYCTLYHTDPGQPIVLRSITYHNAGRLVEQVAKDRGLSWRSVESKTGQYSHTFKFLDGVG